MTEPNQIEFREPVRPDRSRSVATRAALVAGPAVVGLVAVAAAIGASPSTAIGADPSASSSAAPNPAASAVPGTVEPKGGRRGFKGFGQGFGEFGRAGFRDITITAINGSDVSLKTADSWTRTITVTSTTTITKGGATIGIDDLAVGDQVRFAQDRAADGTYTVTDIVVVLPTVIGEVTAIDGSTLTVTQPGGTTATVHVDRDTTYRVAGAAGSLSDVKVGSFIAAEGTQRADGSLDASIVRTGFDRRGDGRGPGWKGDHDQPGASASPAPSRGAS
jgi:Domain of unknown function (DUF5666)